MGTLKNGDSMSDFMNRIFMTAMTFAIMATACNDKNNSSDSKKTTSEKMTTVSAGTEEITESAETNETESHEITSADSVQKTKKTSSSELFSDRDLNPDYSNPTAEISLTGNSAEVNGDGVSVNGSTVTITDEGIYLINGTLDDGRIIVDADENKVQLVLDNASVNCSNSSAIYVASAKKTFITLADGSKNYISDGSAYEFDDSAEDEPDAAIFSKDSLTLNGSGELEVNGNYNDGIRSKDDVVITGGKITVNAVGDAVKGKDYVAVANGDLTLTAGENGINSSNNTDSSMGFVYIEGGNFNITSGGGSSESTKTHSDDFGGFGKSGDFGRGERPDMPDGSERPEFPDGFENFSPEDFEPPEMPDGDFQQQNLAYTTDSESTADTISTKGIKADAEITIVGGIFSINSADDAIHSNSDVVVSGGNLNIDSGNKGIHADLKIDIDGGKVSVDNSYEGLEASVININNGIVEVNASDDGFNASDGETVQIGMGTYSDDLSVNITGGTVFINADGDGLDSNGNINISGGTVIVNGPENSGNGALDSNGEIIVNGGVLLAAGMSGMAECPSETSSQNCVSATFDNTYSGGTLITLSDDSGNEIISFSPQKSFDNIIISSPDIKNGVTYTLYTEGSSSSEEQYGLYANGGYNNDGTEFGSFTAESSVSFVGKQSMMGGGFGGGNRGGMHEPPQDENGMPEMPERDGKDFRHHQ
ncbi:MAG: carbohydrate-binding domain-containing protein [Ruminococcus sp.]|nr:carbohydrate-binding domain-containing protein [Ruminococcus sp.]